MIDLLFFYVIFASNILSIICLFCWFFLLFPYFFSITHEKYYQAKWMELSFEVSVSNFFLHSEKPSTSNSFATLHTRKSSRNKNTCSKSSRTRKIKTEETTNALDCIITRWMCIDCIFFTILVNVVYTYAMILLYIGINAAYYKNNFVLNKKIYYLKTKSKW